MYPVCHGKTKCAVVKSDAYAVKSTISNSLEMQRWMTWIGFELRKISVRYYLNLIGQSVKALPKPL